MASVADGLRSAAHWVQERRLFAFAFALFLVAVPTFASLFPGLIFRTTRVHRIEAMAVWVAVAAAVTIAGQRRESEASSISHAIRETTGALHRHQICGRLSALLDPSKSGIPATYRASVYLDRGDGFLYPWYPDLVVDRSDPKVFGYGKGATGAAFAGGRPIVVVGDAVSSGEWGLNPAQQREFCQDQIVASVPIRDLRDPVIGVLTVISRTNDGVFSTTGGNAVQEGVDLLNELAGKIGLEFDGYQGLG